MVGSPDRSSERRRSWLSLERTDLWPIALVSIAMTASCHQARKENAALNQQGTEDAIAELRASDAAFNCGDLGTAVRFLDPQIEWIEPVEFPGGGIYHGVEGAKH
jgi:hypothetical protein